MTEKQIETWYWRELLTEDEQWDLWEGDGEKPDAFFYDAAPVIIDPGNGYIPRSLGFAVWTEIRAFAAAEDLFEPIEGYVPWFAIFLDGDGCWFTVQYPEEEHLAEGDVVVALVDFFGTLRVAEVTWIHRQYGLGSEAVHEMMEPYLLLSLYGQDLEGLGGR